MQVWLNDRLVPSDAAQVSVFDHGFTVGDGVFETLKVRDGRPFALTMHLARLQRSAHGLGLPLPRDEDVRAAVDAVVGVGPRQGRLRITVTAGAAPLGSERGSAAPTLLVAMGPLGSWPETATLASVPWVRNERSAVAGLKTISYAENVVALAYAQQRGADESLLLDTQGRVSECAAANIFAVIDGELVTPSLDAGCLAGVTRALVLDWSGGREADLSLDALRSAEEVFLTSSTRDVQPVRSLDDCSWPAPGPITREVQATFATRSARDPDPQLA